ncbi:MAG: uroporphyrinogen-III synthase [Flavobacterium sp.]
MHYTVRVLSTKILQPNQKQFLLNAGLTVVEANFISIEYYPVEIKNTNENLIFTSQNSVTSVLRTSEVADLKSKPVFCVGIKTKDLLEKNGFEVLEFTNYAAELVQILASKYSDRKYTFFSGNLRHETIPQGLKDHNISFNEIEVYKTVLSPQKIQSSAEAILFFSPSGVDSYLMENSLEENQQYFCIGTTTSQALIRRNVSENQIHIATVQTVENTIIQVLNYYKTSKSL